MKRLYTKLFLFPFSAMLLTTAPLATAHALTISGDNTGIGTDTPGYPLDVVGSVNAADFIGSGTYLTDIDGSQITLGTVSESRIDPLIARDGEVTSAISGHASEPSAHHAKYTDTEAVAAIKAAGGSGSGLDADLLDGQHASAFAPAAHDHLIFFQKVNGPGYYLTDDSVWVSGISIQLTGPGTLIADFGGRADCESDGVYNTYIRVLPMLDGELVASEYGAVLSTRFIVEASVAETAQIAISEGTHTLGLGARGKTFNVTSTGCLLDVLWMKATFF